MAPVYPEPRRAFSRHLVVREFANIHKHLTEVHKHQIVANATQNEWRLAFLLACLAATAVVLPMFFLGNASGHDFQFHLAGWLDVAGQWREGILFPRWAEWANWGFGEPRFVFYPPTSWMLGAALGSILPWQMAPGAFIWLALLLAGLTMWRLARECLPVPQALTAAILYAVNPYHLVIVYYRSDFAELLAGALFPLLVLGTLRVTRDGWNRVPRLALVFALIWLSNAPAAVIATYSLALLLVGGCALRRELKPLLSGAAAMTGGFGLAAFYILPAAWEQRWVQISQALTENLRPAQNFLFTHSSDPEFVLFNWKVSAIALGTILITALAAVFVARWRRDFLQLWWMLLALAAASAFMMFPASLFLWQHLPKLQFVQFPWRWLVPLDVAFAFFIAALLQTPRKQWLGWTAILLCTGALGTVLVKDAWWDSEDIPVLIAAIHSQHGYEGADEYQPLGCDRYQLPGQPPASADDDSLNHDESPVTSAPKITIAAPNSEALTPVKNENARITRWTAEEKSFAAKTNLPATLALKLINYPAWEVRVDGDIVQAISLPETAQLSLPLPAGEHSLRVNFRRTPDRTIGSGISIFSAFLLLGFSAYSRRKPRAA
ncbi:MAG: 6-pyruvoyl-tetrahydropterin synthase-related protein [Candidatus Acidiferrales bacterium]